MFRRDSAILISIFFLLTGLSTVDDAKAAAKIAPILVVDLLCDENGTDCHGIHGYFEFPAGPAAEFELHFENATNLAPDSLAISVELVDPDDPALQSRLPPANFIPDDFPVLIRIDPKAADPFRFERNWEFELVTENLEFTPFTAFRLLRAADGSSNFEEITAGLGSGSFRIIGAGADFSEFVVANDLRSTRRVVRDKIANLRAALSAFSGSIAAVLLSNLSDRLDEAEAAFLADDYSTALAKVAAFIGLLESALPSDLPDGTTPGNSEVGIAGNLLGLAESLEHTLMVGRQNARSGMATAFQRPIDLGGGVTLVVFVKVEGAFEIDPAEFDITAQLVNPNDPALLARLPAGVQIPAEFPVLVNVNPDDASEQAFRGRIEVEILTEVLDFDTDLRLFKAPDGGAFEDVTRNLALGSFRILGVGADFSDFIIGRDRRDPLDVIGVKLQRLIDILTYNTLPPAAEATLDDIFTRLGDAITAEDYAAAIAIIGELAEFLIEDTEDIPSVWRPDGSSSNLAGDMQALGESMKFQLDFLQLPFADPNDVNDDGMVDLADVFQVIDRVFGQGAPVPLVIRELNP